MKFLIQLCGSFNPILILTLGFAGGFFTLYNTLHSINEGKKSTKGHNLSDYYKTTGVIIDYETVTETRMIKEEGVKKQQIIEHRVPVIQYFYDDDLKTTMYKTYFFKDTPINIGYELIVYVNRKTQIPLIKYSDIYAEEIRAAEKTAYIVCSIIGVLTLVAVILSIISNFI